MLMSKERLEEVKKNVLTSEFDLFGNAYISMPKGNFDWLIQQAELREEQVQRNLQALENISVLEGIYDRLEQQNKRYREVLEFYADKNKYMYKSTSLKGHPTIISDEGEIARKALEGEE